ncbi:tRNA pseudouridine(55) synthase TruB [Candidatus Saccharibacteria bacterium]|nr:tRNA pseudouridine(55) synthase TruB [Candidatus Saccharibacteria bacterium]
MNNDEILLVDKPAGMSSFGVVARVRRRLSEEAGHKVKVGHTGTLDPFATGLLILLTGKGTKRANEFLKLDKEYEATICLGKVSSTGDIEGDISDYPFSGRVRAARRCGGAPLEPRFARASQGANGRNLRTPRRKDVENVLASFVGEIFQQVPSYSAVKINGQRAYKLARAGKEVEMPVRKVTIYNIEILDYKWPELKIRCEVSSGTYIRALGQDIGERLGVGGYLTQLRRTKVGEYRVKDAERRLDFIFT